MISYFVSFHYTNQHGSGFGNCQIDLNQPIRCQDDITTVTDFLRQQVPGDPVVLSFTRFDTGTEGQTR